ncbi:MAG TPA: hypothetical protein VHL11_13375 [Phototrophicaceae bacterium]|jgi:hypothetical protein|nr:hypothetical protein [Phototrophicaceae bacterium]
MGITLSWADDTKKVIIQKYEGSWTWEEFYNNSLVSTSMMESVSHTVHILADFRESGPLPFGGALTHARNSMSNLAANWGLLIIVSDSKLITMLVSVFKKMFGTSLGGKTFTASDFDEAYKIIREHEQGRASLHGQNVEDATNH